MVLVKIFFSVLTIAYLAFVIFIFWTINVQKNHACGIPPIPGCIEKATYVQPTPLAQPEEQLVSGSF
jgi:hypothetical protein